MPQEPGESVRDTGPMSGKIFDGRMVNIGLSFYPCSVPGWLNVFDIDSTYNIIGDILGFLRVKVDRGTPESKLIPAHRITKSGSPASLSVMKEWIRRCDHSHSLCRSGLTGALFRFEPKLPTRVLDLGSPDQLSDLCLVESQGATGQYIALSHCWGNYNHLITTRESLAQHKTRIALHSLSKTFQDAIFVTRSLSIRYLWIDSLCIIQDDDDDWKHEAERMSTVFQDAYCTIAASGAVDGSVGLFLRDCDEVVADVPYQAESGKVSHLYFAPRTPVNYESTQSPLARRGWVVQERILSRRTISFGKEQLYWACLQESFGEDGHNYTLDKDGRLPNGLISCLQKGELTEGQVQIFYQWWRATIMFYSQCILTFPKDMLPALGGLVNLIKDRLKLTYYHGHWFDEELLLLRSLLWHGNLRVPSLRRAPTWSWASVDGAIKFLDLDLSLRVVINGPSMRILSRISALESGLDGLIHAYASLKAPTIGTAGRTKDPHSAVITEWRKESHVGRDLGRIEPLNAHFILEARMPIGWIDFTREDFYSSSVYCVPVFTTISDSYVKGTQVETCLILAVIKIGNHAGLDMYERVGIGAIDTLNWFDDCAAQSVLLV
ncbi:HET-domain-containing protein [Lepidopterella palustris CBS 459.81]|uniref:HET-domain-containing protein n=1 Tax=Lepidopterella palustris CBS 459.81 TaxID=1314670 RepID=A0A8E2E3P0_9PEZI|nr:HET-domain-containing protein [Lepidopterella palustris CBS 459.81]